MPPMPPGPPAKRSSVLPIVAAVMALLLVAGAVGSYFLLRDDDDNASEASDADRRAEKEADAEAAKEADEPEPTASTSPEPEKSKEPKPEPPPLGIDATYANQACSGDYIVMLATSGVAAEYDSKLGDVVRGVRGAKYLRGGKSCKAFLRVDPLTKDPIYNAYLGPFPTMEEACRTLAGLGERHSKAWVRQLANPSKVRELCFCLDEASAAPTVWGAGDVTTLGVKRAVSQAQWALVQAGLNDVTQIYGNYTPEFSRKLKWFQEQSDVPATGALDTATWAALQDDYCSPYSYLVER